MAVLMCVSLSHRIHGAAIYGNMNPINIPPVMLAHIPAPWIRHGCENGVFSSSTLIVIGHVESWRNVV